MEPCSRRSVVSAMVCGGMAALLSGCSPDSKKAGSGSSSTGEAGRSECRIVTPYYSVTLPGSWKGRYYYVYRPDSYYLGGDTSQVLYGPSLSVFLDGDYCTFSVDMSQQAPGYDGVAFNEGLLESEVVGRTGKDDEWDLFVSVPAMAQDGAVVLDEAGRDAKEYATYVEARYDPSAVDDPLVLLAFLGTEEGAEWGHGDGASVADRAISELLTSSRWYGLSEAIDLNAPIERGAVPLLRYAALSISDDRLQFDVPDDEVAFPCAVLHLDAGDQSRYETEARYKIRDWSPLPSDEDSDKAAEYGQEVSQRTGVCLELIESVDDGSNWEKCAVELCQVIPYGGEPYVTLTTEDTAGLTYVTNSESFASSVACQDELLASADALFKRYMGQLDSDDLERFRYAFGAEPRVAYAVSATFEDFQFEPVSGFFIKVERSEDYYAGLSGSDRRYVSAALYDYGNGSVWFQQY